MLFVGNGEILSQAYHIKDTILYALARLEETGLSIMMRESGVAFFSVLTLHSLAMGFVVGINLMMALRLLGLMPGVALSRFRAYLPLHWWFTALIFLSGLALLLAYPAKALTNPVFYLKLFALTTGLALLAALQRRITHTDNFLHPRVYGSLMISCWVVTLFAGRFLAYTHSVLLASSFY